jgi:hypothetical protein
VTDIDMAEIGCELRQFALDVEACTIPLDEPAGCETVTKILEPRPAPDTPASRGCSQADGTAYSGERATRRPALQSSAALRDEKCLGAGSRTELVALLGIVRKSDAC